MVLAPIVRGRKGEYGKLLEELRSEGFARAKVDGELRMLEDEIVLDKKFKHDISIVVDRLVMRARPAQAPGRLDRDGGRAGRRDGRDRDRAARGRGRAELTLYSEKFACLDLRHVDARARAADLLVQLAARRVPALHRPRLADGDRPRAGRAGPDAVDRRGRARAVGERARRSTTSRSPRRSPRSTTSTSRRRGTTLDEDARELFLYGTERRPDRRSPTATATAASARTRRASRASSRTSSAATRRPTPSSSREKIEEYMSMRPCPACKGARLRPESRAVLVGGMRDPRVHRAERPAGAAVAGRGRADRDRAPHRAADPARDRRAAALPRERRHRLPVDGPRGGDAVRRRGAADPAGDADRLGAGRRALHPRRAVDRPAPARQLEADRDARAPARPRQHRDRRRARRADDARGRPPRRHRPGRRRARRARSSRRARRRRSRRSRSR